MLYFNPMWNLFLYRSFLKFAFNTLFSIYRSFTVQKLLKKQISVLTALGFGFFGTITQTMMTAMLKSSNSHSESDNSDSPLSPLAKTHISSSSPKPRPPNFHTNIKIKILNFKKKPQCQDLLLILPQSNPFLLLFFILLLLIKHNPSTPKIFHPLLQFIILTFSLIIIFLLDPLKYLHYLLLYIYIILLLLMTPIVIILLPIPPYITIGQSTKIDPPTPPPIKTNDIPLTSVNNIFDPPDSPVKVYFSCRFPPELFTNFLLPQFLF